MKQKKIDLYDDGIGCVEYVNHMGDDLTIVNSARVSFGVERDELDDKDKKLINYLIKHKHTSQVPKTQENLNSGAEMLGKRVVGSYYIVYDGKANCVRGLSRRGRIA